MLAGSANLLSDPRRLIEISGAARSTFSQARSPFMTRLEELPDRRSETQRHVSMSQSRNDGGRASTHWPPRFAELTAAAMAATERRPSSALG